MINFINFITISRIIFSVFIFIFIVNQEYILYAFILFLISGLSDFFDGYLARKFKAESILGEILDPIADKLLILFSLFALSISLNSIYLAFISALIISREIWVAALRDFNSRLSKTNATKVTFLAKIKTTLQIFSISIYILAIFLDLNLLIIIADKNIFIAFLCTWYTGYQYTIKTFRRKN